MYAKEVLLLLRSTSLYVGQALVFQEILFYSSPKNGY